MASYKNNWSPEEIDILINLVRENEDLYDQSRPGYMNVNNIDRIWRNIANEISTKDAKSCKSKWQILRGTYRVKRNDLQAASGSAAKPGKKWAYFDVLSFLQKHLAERKTSTNLFVQIPAVAEIQETNYLLSPESGLLEPETEVFEPEETLVPENNLSNSLSSSQQSRTPLSKKRRATNSDSVEESFSAYLLSKKPKTSLRSFLESLEEDMSKLSSRGLRQFKTEILLSLGRHLEEEGKE